MLFLVPHSNLGAHLDPLKLFTSNGINFEEGGPTPRCAETAPDLFFPEEVEDENGKLVSSKYTHESEAKAVCVGCDYRVQCLISALKTNDIGIWGGTTENERRRIKRERLDPATYQVRSRKGTKTTRKSSI